VTESIGLIRRELQLRERGGPIGIDASEAIELDLSETLEVLNAHGVIRTMGSAAGVVIIEPANFVGEFRAPRFTISIEPKSRPIFSALTDIAYEMPARLVAQAVESADGKIGISEPENLFTTLLAAEIETGLNVEYRGRKRLSSSPHGHILFTETLRRLRSRGISHEVICFDRICGIDVRLTRVFSKTLEVLHRRGGLESSLSWKIGILRSIFGDDSNIDSVEALHLALSLMENEEWPEGTQRLLQLAASILKSLQDIYVTFQTSAGTARFVNMERVWERAVAILANAPSDKGESANTIVLHPLRSDPTTLFRDGGPPIDPDAISYRDSRPELVIDAKYSLASSVNADDVYQMNAYVSRLGAKTGLIVYLSPASSWRQIVGTTENGAVIHAIGVGEQDLLGLKSVSVLRLFDTFARRPSFEAA
jgi:hypothetical protein